MVEHVDKPWPMLSIWRNQKILVSRTTDTDSTPRHSRQPHDAAANANDQVTAECTTHPTNNSRKHEKNKLHANDVLVRTNRKGAVSSCGRSANCARPATPPRNRCRSQSAHFFARPTHPPGTQCRSPPAPCRLALQATLSMEVAAVSRFEPVPGTTRPQGVEANARGGGRRSYGLTNRVKNRAESVRAECFGC